jgi:hypothetical protein
MAEKVKYCHDFRVIIGGVWNGDRIYVLFDTARDYTLRYTVTYPHHYPQSHIHYRCLIAATNDGRSLPRCSRIVRSFSLQQLTTTEPQQSSD